MKTTLTTLEVRVVALEELIAKHESTIGDLRTMIEELKTAPANPVRDRGPSSTREMTEADARKVMIGEMAGISHRKAAEELGLSYGQIYSARNGYTFKGIYKEMKDLEKAPKVVVVEEKA